MTSREITGGSVLFSILWMKLIQSTNLFYALVCLFFINMFYLPVLANSGISELFLKAINCEVGVTFVLEEALAFIPQSNRVRIKCSGLRWKELKRYFLWFYGSNINLRVFRILKEGILSILIDWSVEDKKLNKIKFILFVISTCHCMLWTFPIQPPTVWELSMIC